MASIGDYLSAFVERIPGLQELGQVLTSASHRVALSGRASRQAADVLHGKQAGHPVHPILTDITVGSWVLGAAFDVASWLSHSSTTRRTADTLIAIGVASAVPTMLTGLADYSGLSREATKVGTLHGLLNVTGLALYGLSLASRRQGARGAGLALSMVGLGVMSFSAYLGGDLVYRLQVGVNRNRPPAESGDWIRLMAVHELPEREPRRFEVGDRSILLYRLNGAVRAISAVCSHAGGPLEQGRFEDGCVECPWHQSVFDLADGTVVHGPATFSQPVHDVWIRDGYIHVCTTPATAVEHRFDALPAR